jgi:excisionase family DNA binding protein
VATRFEPPLTVQIPTGRLADLAAYLSTSPTAGLPPVFRPQLDQQLSFELDIPRSTYGGALALTERLRTAREVADLLGVSSETVLRRTGAGRLPGYRIGGRALRFDSDEIDAWLDARATATGAGGGASVIQPNRTAPAAPEPTGVIARCHPVPPPRAASTQEE